jgi:hypothetical protein
MIHIGFTGTRYGITDNQIASMTRLMKEVHESAGKQVTAHHGDCEGADAFFHVSASVFGWRIHVHPPIGNSRRAHCAGDVTAKPKPYLVRNADIVAESDVMFAMPLDMTEQARGGTWATIRMARKAGKPLAIVWPDGNVTKERWP